MTEFKKGDPVTFKAYGNAIPAKVADIIPPNQTFNNSEEVRYRLIGAGKTPLLSITTGRSIVESELFEEAKEEGWLK